MNIEYRSTTLPVIKKCDLVIEGGSFAACSSALQHARCGKNVVLIESRTYLGWEMTACLRPWMTLEELEKNRDLFPILHSILTEACCKRQGDEMIFNLDQVKLALEDCLLNLGVKIIYASRVIDALEEAGELIGVVIGNKSCRQVIQCREYLNYPPEIVLPPEEYGDYTSGEKNDPLFWRSLEFSGIDLSGVRPLALPEFLGKDNGFFRFHRGFFGDRHWYVEFPIAPEVIHAATTESDIEFSLQELSMQTARYLLNNVESFDGAYWAGESYESWRRKVNMFVPASPPEHYSHRVISPTKKQLSNNDTIAVSELDVYSNSASGYITVPVSAVPLQDCVDILVVGGGTSGVAAALLAAGHNLRTLVIEMNPRVGGTGTIGGVQSYWFGRDSGFSAELLSQVVRTHEELKQPVPTGNIPRWNIEVKAWTQLKILHDQHVRVMFNSQVIGTIVNDHVISGIVISSPQGVFAVKARVVIDATGDGDLAAFSGVPFTYGSERSNAVLWCSLAQFSSPGQTRNNFTSMVDIGNIEDYTRAILAGRRRGGKTCDHGVYLCTRESRHIHGDVCLTLTDQLRQRHFEDVIQIAFSNYDVKGHTDSDWLRSGLIPPNLKVEIPLRAILPCGIEQLLVVGKAISAQHDALPTLRMQRDVENLGAAAGEIAALSIELDCQFREIPVREIQNNLIKKRLLPADVLSRPEKHQVVDVRKELTRIEKIYPLYAYSDMEISEVWSDTIPFVELCCSGEKNIPSLRRELDRSSGPRKRLLAQVLAMMGDAGGIDDLLDGIKDQLREGFAPARNAAIRNVQLPPDQGAMPDVVYWLYSLGMIGDERAVPIWEQVVTLLQHSSVEDFYSLKKGTFYYIDAVCYGAERLGSPKAGSLLNRLLRTPCLHNNVSLETYQVDFVKERIAFLELGVARAMLRCGLPDGLPVLIDYLLDQRANLRGHAFSLLRRFTGMYLKVDHAAWSDWYVSGKWELTACPDRSPTDAMSAWRLYKDQQ